MLEISTKMQRKKEDAYIPSQESTQDSTIFRFPAIFTSCKSHDHYLKPGSHLRHNDQHKKVVMSLCRKYEHVDITT